MYSVVMFCPGASRRVARCCVLVLLCGWLLPHVHAVAMTGTTADTSKKLPILFQQLRDWLIERGGFISDKLGFVDNVSIDGGSVAAGNDRGAVASVPIQEGELLMLVPYGSLLRLSLVGGADPLLAEVRQMLRARSDLTRDPTFGGQQQLELSIWLAKEFHNRSSEWRPLLDLLPGHFASSLLAVDDVYVRAALSGSDLLQEVLQVRKIWRNAHHYLTEGSALYRAHVGDYKEFLYARLCVLSRVYAMDDTGPGSEHSFVVFLDMLNHEYDAPTRWGEEPARGGFTVYASKAIAQGAAVTTSYGDHRTSRDLLLHHDFAPVTNPGDAVTLTFPLNPRDSLFSQKQSTLLAMDVYRSYTFSGRDGFAATGSPIRLHEGFSSLPLAERESLLFDDVLLYLRVAALEPGDLQSDPMAERALFKDDGEAREALRGCRAASGPELEARAATLLEEACNEGLGRLGGDRSAADILDALRLATAQVETPLQPELPHIASAVAATLAGERGLLHRLHMAAVGVRHLAAKGDWPAAALAMHGSRDNLMAAWAQLYQKALEIHSHEAPFGLAEEL